jgi:hypothetical protein
MRDNSNLNIDIYFSIFGLVDIFVGSQDHRTHCWKGANQGPFHQSLVAIGPVVSEEKMAATAELNLT